LGAATKLFPGAALPAMWRTMRSRGRGRWLAAAAAAVAVINIPIALIALGNWRHFFDFSSERPPDFSIWNALSITSVPIINALTLAILAAAALLAMRYARTPMAARYAVAGILAVWLATNKVSSPQFSLWLFAATALVAAPLSIWLGLVAASTFDFACELWLYPRHALALHPVVAAMVWARTAAVLWFAWWCWRQLRVEVAGDEGAEGGGGVGGDGTGLPNRLHLAR
jgi:hypothetical protein